jgi:hypothetical protein
MGLNIKDTQRIICREKKGEIERYFWPPKKTQFERKWINENQKGKAVKRNKKRKRIFICLVHIIETMLFQFFGKSHVEVNFGCFLNLEYETMFIFIVYCINISI